MGLILPLYLEISPGGILGTICCARDGTQVGGPTQYVPYLLYYLSSPSYLFEYIVI